MHGYGVDSNERQSIPFFVAFVAMGASYLLRTLFHHWNLDIGDTAHLPSTFAIYGLLHLGYDNYGWRWTRRVGLTRIPDLTGPWKGQLVSSHSGLNRIHEVTVRIHQTWSMIRITLEGARSQSRSEMASIVAVSPSEFELRWEYRAEAKQPDEGREFNHRGLTRLRVQLKDRKILPDVTGDYYTQHGRDTNGTIVLRRVEE